MAAVDSTVEFPALPSFKGTTGWEFTPLGDLDVDGFAPAPGADAAVASSARALFADVEGTVGLTPADEPATSEGPVILSLATARERHPDLIAKHLGAVVKPSPLVARNDAQWTDGAFVYVPRNVHVEAPIRLTAVHEQAGTALHTRTLVVLEEGAQAEVWDELYSADDDTEGLVNTVVELSVGANARLRYIGAQNLNEKSYVLGTQRAIVAADGHLDWITLGFGAKLGKVFLESKLDGRGAHAAVTGAYATHARQHLDFDTLQEHAAPSTTSDLAFRGILDGRSRTVWRGMIQVDKDAQQTDAFQESRNLLLGGKAHADAIPGLEILADDVRCTHAAAIAKIDAEQLFYLRSRGLPEGTAQRLVIEGFLQALVERFEEGTVREAVAAALDARLAAVLS
ncbi:MAG: FeS assembly protein SufD [Solirubrobacterales bacterium]|nr:FeS assembly protein SufD [Solirubrobacterales bacterium]